jgi:hypothetical protein
LRFELLLSNKNDSKNFFALPLIEKGGGGEGVREAADTTTTTTTEKAEEFGEALASSVKVIVNCVS